MTFLEFNEGGLVLVLGDLSCGRRVDLSLYDVENALASSFVTKSEQPCINEMHPTPLEKTIDDLQETNKKIFLMLTLSKQESNSVEPLEQSVPDPVPDVPTRSVFDALMVQHTHYPAIKLDSKTGDVRQCNAVVSYTCDQKSDVKGTVLHDFENLLRKFCSLLWEIDPHYSKLKARGCSSLNLIEKLFLGFNNPQSHGHKAKQLCSTNLTFNVNCLRTFRDCAFLSTGHLKKFKNFIGGVCGSLEKYVNYLEKQVKSVKEHPIENFTITKLKFKNCSNDVWNERFLNLKNILTEIDFFFPIELRNISKKSNSRQSFSNTINTLFQEGFPYNLPNCNLFHLKLPSQDPYEAVHVIWKQSNTECDNTQELLKLLDSLKSSCKTFYIRAMRKEIQFKLKQLGVVKPHIAIFIIKDLLGDQSACSSQNENEILERLNTAISRGKDIIVGLRKNNGATPKFDQFWEVILFRLLLAKIFI